GPRPRLPPAAPAAGRGRGTRWRARSRRREGHRARNRPTPGPAVPPATGAGTDSMGCEVVRVHRPVPVHVVVLMTTRSFGDLLFGLIHAAANGALRAGLGTGPERATTPRCHERQIASERMRGQARRVELTYQGARTGR